MLADKLRALAVVLVGSCFYSATLTSAQPHKELSAKFDADFRRVFAENEGEEINPETLRPILKELWKVGSELERADETIKAVKLFILGDIEPARCEPDSGTFEMFRQTMADSWQYQVNVMPYLEHYKRRLINVCKRQLETLITKAVLSLGDEKTAHIVGMMSTISSFMSGYNLKPPIPVEVLEQSLPAVLRIKSKIQWRDFSFNDGDKVHKAIYREFDRFIARPCEDLTSELGKAIDIYYNLPSYESLESQADWVQMTNWIKYGSVCLDIIGEIKQIESSNTIDLIEKMKFRLTGKRIQLRGGVGLAQLSPPR